MGDSDDEYDRKRRDKFRGERSSGGGGGGADNYRSDRRDDRRGGGGGGARDEWPERNPFRGGAGAARPRPDYRDYRGPRDRYGSPGRDLPPAKRMRGDWGDELGRGPRYPPYDPYLMHAWNEHYAHSLHAPYNHAYAHRGHEAAVSADTQTQPAMLTLKQFLETQDDGISDSEVMKKYTDYKLEFKRQQLNEFFVAHKDEEWFKNKYHPVDSVKRKEEQLGFLQKRVEVFNEVLQNGLIKSVSVDTTQTDALLRLLDTVVIKLEGGTEEDLKILDEKPKEIIINERVGLKKPEADDDVIITSVENEKKEDTSEAIVVSPSAQLRTAGSDEENWDEDEEAEKPKSAAVTSEEKPKTKREKKTLKRKRKNTDSSSSSSSESESSSSSSSEWDGDEDDEKVNKKYDLSEEKENAVKPVAADDEVSTAQTTNATSPSPATPKEENEMDKVADKLENEADDATHNEEDEVKVEQMEITEEKLEETTTTVATNGNEAAAEPNQQVNEAETTENATVAEDAAAANAADDAKVAGEPETIDLDNVKDTVQPRALHRTSSIFLRNLAPAITKADIEAICKGFDGFLRVAIADPSVERRWYRRGWVTFKRDVNIKEICWNLNNTRLRDCEMGAIVNRDLSRRVRPVNGMTGHKIIVRSDIKLCAKIALNLDEKFRLWSLEKAANAEQNGSVAEAAPTSTNTFGFKSNNPVLQNITDFLIEEASAEEEELLGIAGESKDNENSDGLDRDPQLITVLDNLILYLRIVHSVDFYNHCEYPYEDEMPNRCGIIHARGPAPSKINPNDMQDYIKNFESKMQTFLAKTTTLEEEELKNLGCKDAEAEVEKFVQANTQELAKDKWLCPLSGKKFKGPEFIRKHIFNKHGEKVEEVRKEVEYFNNYLKDPKRPQLPEHPGSNKRTTSESSGGGGYRAPYPPAYAPPYAPYAPLMMPPRGARGFGGPPPRRAPNEYRQLIQYRDLDAPQDNLDIFN